MRNDTMDLSEAISLESLKRHGLTEGLKVELEEVLTSDRSGRIRQRRIHGEVLAVNDRIFTLKTDTYRRIESFHLCDLFRGGSLRIEARP